MNLASIFVFITSCLLLLFQSHSMSTTIPNTRFLPRGRSSVSSPTGPTTPSLHDLRTLAKDESVQDNDMKTEYYIKSGGYYSKEVRDSTYNYLLTHLTQRHKIKKEKRKSAADLDTFGLI